MRCWSLFSKISEGSVFATWVRIHTCCSYQKKTYMSILAGFQLTFMDEFVDQLLTEERVCDIILPRIQKRSVLEENGELGPRKSRLLEAMEGKEREQNRDGRGRSGSVSPSVSPRSSRGRSPNARSSSPAGSRYVSRSRSRSKSGSPAGSRYVSRSRSRSGSPAASFRSKSGSISPDRMETE
jgi:pre-mRNA-splicing factor 38A